MNHYLQKLIDETSKTVAALKIEVQANPDHPLRSNQTIQPKSFKQALAQQGFHIIAEIKRQSPSKGKLAEIKDPTELAKSYEQGGASAISVLTNKQGFGGSVEDLSQVTNQVNIPVIRKEFIIDPIQIIEAKFYGASAVLLIVAMTQEKTQSLLQTCREQHIDAVVEVHTKEELDYALSIGADIIGINNRNLHTFEIDPTTALQLKQHIPNSVISIAESGVKTIEDAKQYKDAGFNAVLIGEALVTQQDPVKFIQEITQ